MDFFKILPLIQILLTYLLFTVYCDTDSDISLVSSDQEFWETRFITHTPILKMLKRQIRNFRNGHRATITVVYQATRPVQVRWFRHYSRISLTNSEVLNKLPIEGDADYEISNITSGEVTAVTLAIVRYQEISAQDFETILTTIDGAIQYQLRTHVKSRQDGIRLDNIDSPEWLLNPKTEIQFQDRSRLDVHCAVFVPRESSAFTNELTLSRANLSTDHRQNQIKMEFLNIVSIHKDTPNIAEQQGPALLIGRRHRTRNGHVIYQVGLSTGNATSAFAGKYQCNFERQYDKLFVLSTVAISGHPLVVREPAVELISCERNNFNATTKVLTLTEGVATCIRCRAVSNPRPTVGIYHGNVELGSFGDGVGVSKFTNVADGGVEEATYTFHRPRSSVLQSGVEYSCRAENQFKRGRGIQFRIRFQSRQ